MPPDFKKMTPEERWKIVSDPDFEGTPDDENPEWTEEDFKNAKPFADVFPELAEKIAERRRGRPPKDNPKVAVSLRLDADVVEKFKATGPGWQTLINEKLKEVDL